MAGRLEEGANMRGISEERLREEIESYDYDIRARDILNGLIDECQELNQWQPIDNNTPTHCLLLMYYPPAINQREFYRVGYFYNDSAIHKPSYWMPLPELPEPPK